MACCSRNSATTHHQAHTEAHTDAHTHTHTEGHTDAHTHTHTHIHTHRHACTYTHICTHTHLVFGLDWLVQQPHQALHLLLVSESGQATHIVLEGTTPVHSTTWGQGHGEAVSCCELRTRAEKCVRAGMNLL